MENNKEETIQSVDNSIGSKLEEIQIKAQEKLQTLRIQLKDEFQITNEKIEVLEKNIIEKIWEK